MILNPEKIKGRMKQLGLSQKELAEKVGVHATAVSWWITGKSDPLSKNMELLAKALECSVEHLIGAEEVPNNSEIKKNGSGYNDYTAYKAIVNVEKEREEKRMTSEQVINAGEIWKVRFGTAQERMVVVIAVHRRCCSCLTLLDENRNEDEVAVIAGNMKYVNPTMLSFAFNSSFIDFVRCMSDEEFSDIKSKVGERLGFESGAVHTLEIDTSMKDELKEVKAQNVALKQQVESLSNKTVETSSHADIIKLETERDIYKRQYETLLESMLQGR